MIDFRYHLVSLISVFLALAVGIVLGAGPLQGPIGSSLQSQVDGLRTDRDTLRADLDVSRAHTEQTAAFVEATAADLIADTLTDRSVALVRLAGSDNDAADAVSARVEEAGGAVDVDVSLTEGAFEPADAALLTSLRDTDPTLPDDDAAVIPAAMARALGAQSTDAQEQDSSPSPGADAADDESTDDESADSAEESRAASEALFDVLTEADRIEAGEWGDADAAVVIAPSLAQDAVAAPAASPSPTATEDEGTITTRSAAVAAYADFASALAGESTVVVAGPTTSAVGGLVEALRSDRVDLSTVDGTDLSTGAVLVPLVVSAALDGAFGDYGTAQGATAVLPDRAQ
ncbi:copper transporter [Brevibacterium yomogidense]|uniref:copper transporter n=1 Tax=Brevibacterium yomogidense TaxID=946573 RepID=UPI0018DFE5A0